MTKKNSGSCFVFKSFSWNFFPFSLWFLFFSKIRIFGSALRKSWIPGVLLLGKKIEINQFIAEQGQGLGQQQHLEAELFHSFPSLHSHMEFQQPHPCGEFKQQNFWILEIWDKITAFFPFLPYRKIEKNGILFGFFQLCCTSVSQMVKNWILGG